MKRLLVASLLLLAAGAVWAGTRRAESTSTEEHIDVGENTRIAIAVPEKWTLTRSLDGGYPFVHLMNEDRSISLQISIFPDDNGLMADEDLQLVMLGDLVGRYVEDSVEKGAQLRPLRPRRGGGQYCVFTDAKLVGVKDIPANEYRHVTTGLKTGSGWFAVFSLFSQDTDSADYRTGLGLLRDSLHPDGTPTSDAKPRRNPHAF